jgi:hypothetical protein
LNRGDHVKVVVRVKSSSVESDVDLSGFEVLDRSASQVKFYQIFDIISIFHINWSFVQVVTDKLRHLCPN